MTSNPVSKSRASVVIIVIVILTYISCASISSSSTSTWDIGDGGFLSGDPCGPPCFWGIIPGQTTESEVIEILQRKGVYASCEVQISRFQGAGKMIVCGLNFAIRFSPEGNYVEGINFRPSISFTLRDVVAKYGEPDGVLLYLDGVPEHPRIDAYLVYLNLLSRLDLPSQKWPGYVIEPSTQVLEITYNLTLPEVKHSLMYREWKGYGEY